MTYHCNVTVNPVLVQVDVNEQEIRAGPEVAQARFSIVIAASKAQQFFPAEFET
jgi:hypothetical protein